MDQAGDLLAARTKLRAAEWAVWPEGVRILLAQGEVRAAHRWVAAWGVSLDEEPVLWRAPEYLALARVTVADGRPEAALLRSLQAIAAAGGCRGLEAEICLVLALARTRAITGADCAAVGEATHRAATGNPGMVDAQVGVQTPIVWETDDIQATYEDLNAKGVEFPQEPTQQFWGGFEATFKDSAGNLKLLQMKA